MIGQLIRYKIQHKLVTESGVVSLISKDNNIRETRNLHRVVKKMMRFMQERNGPPSYELQRDRDGYAIWRPGEEVTFHIMRRKP